MSDSSVILIDQTNDWANLPDDARCELCNKLLSGIEGAPFRYSGGKKRKCATCMKGFYPGSPILKSVCAIL